MSRISRYQDNIDSFLKRKSCITKMNNSNYNIVTNILDQCDHLSSLLLLTVLNSQCKKKHLKLVHGYFMACGIDIMMLLNRINDNRAQYEENHGKDKMINLKMELLQMITMCLTRNIDTVQSNMDKQTTLKISQACHNYLSGKIYDICKYDSFVADKKMKKFDVMNYNFDNKSSIMTKLGKMYRIDKDTLVTYVESHYGNACKSAAVLGWLLGDGDEKSISTLEDIGSQFGMILKIQYDFVNLENDIKLCNKTTTNLLVNMGVQECHAMFMESKIKFIEGCMKLNIYTNTAKEMIDLIESKIDACLEKSTLDMKSIYSSFS